MAFQDRNRMLSSCKSLQYIASSNNSLLLQKKVTYSVLPLFHYSLFIVLHIHAQVNTFDTLGDYVSLHPYFMQCILPGYWSEIEYSPSLLLLWTLDITTIYSASNSLKTEGLWKLFLAACLVCMSTLFYYLCMLELGNTQVLRWQRTI